MPNIEKYDNIPNDKFLSYKNNILTLLKERRIKMEADETWQNLKEVTKRRDDRKKILQGVIVLAICVTCKFDCYAATVSETLDVFESSDSEILETNQTSDYLIPIKTDENSEEGFKDIVEESRKREEERIQKETEIQRGREKARAEERQEVRRQAIAYEEEVRKAEEKAKSERFLYLLPEEELLGKIIEAEAAKSPEDRRRTGSVVLNRVRTTFIDFRDVHTIHEVLYQDRQYHDDTKKAIEEGLEASPEAKEVAHGLLTGNIPCLKERILFQSSTEKDWMAGHVKRSDLPDQEQFYGEPIHFKEGCLPLP